MAEESHSENVLLEDEVADVEMFARTREQSPALHPGLRIVVQQSKMGPVAFFVGEGVESLPEGYFGIQGIGEERAVRPLGELNFEEQIARHPGDD
jgi:hypothetical protein